MKLSKLFHTLYATVMALPVLIIPIFALNILHKETEPISIEVQEKMSVDFNSYEGGFNSTNTTQLENNIVRFEKNANSGNYFTIFTCNLEINHIYAFNGIFNYQNIRTIYMTLSSQNNILSGGTFKATATTSNASMYAQIDNTSLSANADFYREYYDLTKMFGYGNEPTYEEFILMFPNTYYEPVESQKMLVNKPIPTTYNSTDIGSQFIYALYKPVNDYFNFGEFFGLGGMYDWFQLNIFNGTAPLSFFIVFNVMIYWLFISLFWLLFDILIYVPMVIHKWLDKAEM